MRSHVTYVTKYSKSGNDFVSIPQAVWDHMWRNTYCWNIWRYLVSIPQAVWDHMWPPSQESGGAAGGAVSIPQAVWDHMWPAILIVPYMGFTSSSFNTASGMRSHVTPEVQWKHSSAFSVSIPQAVWDHMWPWHYAACELIYGRFNTASGMRSHVTISKNVIQSPKHSFNTASGMRSHVTCWFGYRTWSFGCFNTASGMRSHVTRVKRLEEGVK